MQWQFKPPVMLFKKFKHENQFTVIKFIYIFYFTLKVWFDSSIRMQIEMWSVQYYDDVEDFRENMRKIDVEKQWKEWKVRKFYFLIFKIYLRFLNFFNFLEGCIHYHPLKKIPNFKYPLNISRMPSGYFKIPQLFLNIPLD